MPWIHPFFYPRQVKSLFPAFVYMYQCMFEGRKKGRETAFVKIISSLGKTKMDLCAVIYRKWLGAGRVERLVFFSF